MSNNSNLSRRDFVKTAGAAGLVIGGAHPVSASSSEQVTDIGTRRELFVETTLVSKLTGGGQLWLHQPTSKELAFVWSRVRCGRALARVAIEGVSP